MEVQCSLREFTTTKGRLQKRWWWLDWDCGVPKEDILMNTPRGKCTVWITRQYSGDWGQWITIVLIVTEYQSELPWHVGGAGWRHYMWWSTHIHFLFSSLSLKIFHVFPWTSSTVAELSCIVLLTLPPTSCTAAALISLYMCWGKMKCILLNSILLYF